MFSWVYYSRLFCVFGDSIRSFVFFGGRNVCMNGLRKFDTKVLRMV